MAKPKKSYLAFQEREVATSRKTKVWHCYNISSELFLGKISWATNFRAYAFEPNGPNIIFDSGCLLDIASFILNANRSHRMKNSKESKQIAKLMRAK